MREVIIVMPKMGESVMEATILHWLKQEGETVEEEESILEVATDKVDTEVPTAYPGVLKKILAKEGEVIPIGQPIALITTTLEETTYTNNEGGALVSTVDIKQPPLTREQADEQVPQAPCRTTLRSFYSPLVRSIAQQKNISLQELEQIPGTGKEGRITKKDILTYLENDKKAASIAIKSTGIATAPKDEIIFMDRMRKMIAERMVTSKRIAPHVTSFVEADVSNIVYWREQYKVAFKQKEGIPLTYTSIFIETIVKAIKDFPMINAAVQGDQIIKKKAINIGLAVALSAGNLIVPVIKDADQLSLTALARKVKALVDSARAHQLNPDDLADATYTVSNIGTFKNLMGTPIIMQPQVAILALGAIVKKPAVIETPQGDAIAIRHKMFLSHSYDHRIIDGALGGMFAQRVADYLEAFDVSRQF